MTVEGPFRAVNKTPLPFKSAAVSVERRLDRTILLRSPYAPGVAPRSIAHLLLDRAAEHPERPFLMRRDEAGAWAGVRYGEAVTRARALGQWLLDQAADAAQGVMILSANSIEHALVTLGAAFAGVPAIPLSEAYSLMPGDCTKLLRCVQAVRPRVVFAQDGDRFAEALSAITAFDASIVVLCVDNASSGRWDEAAQTPAGAGVDAAMERIEPDTVAKILFTSGSTGSPKAVPQTHRMMSALIAAREGLLRNAADRFPPITLDWMPWSHVSGGNVAFNHNIWAGGTFYIDDGRPVPGRFDTTFRNFLELGPEMFGSAPIAFEMLASALEREPDSRPHFFRNLRWMAYGGATLSSDVYERIQQLALAAVGRRVPILTTYGATETQGITTVYWDAGRVGLIGLPIPGVTLKLVPAADKLEVRVKGGTVMRGYFGEAGASSAAFDDEGFYRLGDAARFVDPRTPEAGLVFDGRVAEDFKLSSGTWVSVGTLRPEVIAACSPFVRDVVLVGQDRPYLTLILWAAADHAADGTTSERIADCLVRFNRGAGGASRRIGRFVLLDEAPSTAAGEITDKGYVNQRRVIDRRADLVELLYAEPAGSSAVDLRSR